MELIRLLLSLHSLTAWAACADVDHSDHFGAIRDQGSLGWCFANSSADLLGEYLKLQPPDEISAFDVAVAFLAPDRRQVVSAVSTPELAGKMFQTGSNTGAQVLQLLMKDKRLEGKSLADREGGWAIGVPTRLFVAGGYCLEARLPSRPLKGQANHAVWDAGADHEGLDFVRDEIGRIEKEKRVHALTQPTCTNVSFGSLQNPLDPKLKNALTELALREVRRAIDQRCGQRHHFKPPEAKQTAFDPSTLQGVLASGKSAEIVYNVIPLTNPTMRSEKALNESGEHSSLIVGMRKVAGGACEYHLRNSWGADCAAYDPEVARDCKAGAFWVDEKQLSKLAHTITQYL